MSTVSDFLNELADRRTKLVDERDRLTALVEQVDSILFEHRGAGEGQRRRPRAAAEPSEKEELRGQIISLCREAHPHGLMTSELFERISPTWTVGELTMRRIGTLCAATTELAGSGSGPYYYVPAEGEEMEHGKA